MANPAAWFGQGEQDVQSVTSFVDPSTGAQYVVHNAQPLPVVNGALPITSLSAVSATGGGTALDNTVARSNHNLVITTSAGVSAGAVKLEGSLDNSNWFQLVAPITTAAATTTYQGAVANIPARYVRANVSTTITGGTVTVLVASSG